MATIRMVFKWRGIFRGHLSFAIKLLTSMLAYNVRHAADPPFSPADVGNINTVIIILQHAHDLKVPKT